MSHPRARRCPLPAWRAGMPRAALPDERQPPQHTRAPRRRTRRRRSTRNPPAHPLLEYQYVCSLPPPPPRFQKSCAAAALRHGDLGPQGDRLRAARDGELGELVLERGDALLEGLVLGAAARQLKLERLDVRLLALPRALGAQAVLQEALPQLVVHLGEVVGAPLRRGAGGPEVIFALDREGWYRLVVRRRLLPCWRGRRYGRRGRRDDGVDGDGGDGGGGGGAGGGGGELHRVLHARLDAVHPPAGRGQRRLLREILPHSVELHGQGAQFAEGLVEVKAGAVVQPLVDLVVEGLLLLLGGLLRLDGRAGDRPLGRLLAAARATGSHALLLEPHHQVHAGRLVVQARLRQHVGIVELAALEDDALARHLPLRVLLRDALFEFGHRGRTIHRNREAPVLEGLDGDLSLFHFGEQVQRGPGGDLALLHRLAVVKLQATEHNLHRVIL
mmetsp:Transcript_43097/g.107853  ORF Transcript_43097/g.107853 Transcript_43097/m.107853 type:complete len:445 (+) Transcript_43097:300-1634(+)